MLRRAFPRLAVIVLSLALVTSCGTAQEMATATSSLPSNRTHAAATAQTVPSPASVTSQDWKTVGHSIEGRPIRVRSWGRGPRAVLFIGGIHGDEAEGSYATEQLPAAFKAAGLEGAVTLTILEDANPDGRAAGTRGNVNGVDVNRNFPATNFDPSNGGTPLSQPESRAVVETINAVQPALVIVAHSWSGDQFINFDGPAGDLADLFSASSGLPIKASSEFAPTPGSLGSYVGRDRGIPVLTIEVRKGSDPQVVWEALRQALLQVIEG